MTELLAQGEAHDDEAEENFIYVGVLAKSKFLYLNIIQPGAETETETETGMGTDGETGFIYVSTLDWRVFPHIKITQPGSQAGQTTQGPDPAETSSPVRLGTPFVTAKP